MSAFETRGRYRMGDYVRAKSGTQLVGIVTEVTIAHNPGRETLYRVRIPMEPEPLWMVFRESEIEPAKELPPRPVREFPLTD